MLFHNLFLYSGYLRCHAHHPFLTCWSRFPSLIVAKEQPLHVIYFSHYSSSMTDDAQALILKTSCAHFMQIACAYLLYLIVW